MMLLFWIVCGFIAYGLSFAYLQNEFYLIAEEEHEKDRALALLLGILGPLGLLAHIIVEFVQSGTIGKHGIKLI